MGRIKEKCLEPYHIVFDQRNYMVVLPFEKPREKVTQTIEGYYKNLTLALSYIVDQKARAECEQVKSVTLTEYINTYQRIKEEISLLVIGCAVSTNIVERSSETKEQIAMGDKNLRKNQNQKEKQSSE